MLFNATQSEETRVAIVDGHTLVDIDIESARQEQRKSNIYVGVITKVEQSLEACFVDYGEERQGFLPFKEISRIYFPAGSDVRTITISEAVKEGQELLVQVEKEERGTKGSSLTTFVSVAGRYLVLMPLSPRGGGVSRRIEGEERQELRETMDRLPLPSGMSLIARTAGIGRTQEELQWDLTYLLKLWDAITEAATPQYEYTEQDENGRSVKHYTTEPKMKGRHLKRANPAPYLIVEESNLVIRAIRDYFQPDMQEVLVDTDDIYEQARQFMAHVMPDMVDRIKRYRDDTPIFSRFQIERQIESAYSRTVPLPSGGAIVIDHTEALVAVDVNSARATRGSDIEETAFRTNLEAADEVARQMRLRDLGGLVVIDFIDMYELKNQRAIEQRMRDAIRPDRARVQIGRISRFGLLELSRQRLRPSLSEGSHVTCPRCNGVGVIRDTESCALQVLRILREEASKDETGALHAQVPVDVATFLLNEKRPDIVKLENRYRTPIVLIPNSFLETPHHHIERLHMSDDRLNDEVASYNRAEEFRPVVDDPYAAKRSSEKKDRPKQVPVIKSILPTEVAPVHEERKPEQKPAGTKAASSADAVSTDSVWEKVLSFLGLGPRAARAPVKKEDEEKPAQPARSERSGGRSGRQGDRRRGQGRGSCERRPRGSSEDRGQKRREDAQRAPAQQRESAEERQGQQSRRRQRRPRQEQQAQPAAPEAEIQQQEALQARAVPVQEPAAEEPAVVEIPPVEEMSVDRINEALDEARIEDRRARRERRQGRKNRDQARPEQEVLPLQEEAEIPAEAENDTPSGDGQQTIESEPRRRRPRRRRRTSHAPEEAAAAAEVKEDGAAEEILAAPATDADEAVPAPEPAGEAAAGTPAEAPAPEVRAEPPAEEAAPQEEDEAPATEPAPAEAAPEEEPVEEAVPSGAEGTGAETAELSEEPAGEGSEEQAGESLPEEAAEVQSEAVSVQAAAAPSSGISSGLEENLSSAGLVQVQTKAEFVQPVAYEPVKYPGRPRRQRQAEESGPLVQVETQPSGRSE